MKNVKLIFIFALFGYACTTPPDAKEIVKRSVEAYGADEFEDKIVSFDFRDKHYTVNRTSENYIYTRSFSDSLGYVEDSLINSSRLTRSINKKQVDLTEEWQTKYGNSVNSVLYFFQIPYVLNDPAVNKSLIGTAVINEEPYFAIEVTFDTEGGGEDYEDEYRYWIHQRTYFIDFFAYNYQTDGGGTRFRQAINRKKVNGLTVQDYINYRAKVKFPPLDSLPVMFEREELLEVSRIYNENIEVTTPDKI